MKVFKTINIKNIGELSEHQDEVITLVNQMIGEINNLPQQRELAISMHARDNLRNSDDKHITARTQYFGLLEHEFNQTKTVAAILSDKNSHEYRDYCAKLRAKCTIDWEKKNVNATVQRINAKQEIDRDYEAKLALLNQLMLDVAPFAHLLHLTAAELMATSVVTDAIISNLSEMYARADTSDALKRQLDRVIADMRSARPMIMAYMHFLEKKHRTVLSPKSETDLNTSTTAARPSAATSTMTIVNAVTKSAKRPKAPRPQDMLRQTTVKLADHGSVHFSAVPAPESCADGMVYLKRRLAEIYGRKDLFVLTDAFSLDRSLDDNMPMELVDYNFHLVNAERLPTIRDYFKAYQERDIVAFAGDGSTTILEVLNDWLDAADNCLRGQTEQRLVRGESTLFVSTPTRVQNGVCVAQSPEQGQAKVKPIELCIPIPLNLNLFSGSQVEEAPARSEEVVVPSDPMLQNYRDILIEYRKELLQEVENMPKASFLKPFTHLFAHPKEAKLEVVGRLLSAPTLAQLKTEVAYLLRNEDPALSNGIRTKRLRDICDAIYEGKDKRQQQRIFN